MNESTGTKPYEPCIALRKDGRPCRAVGRIFDPERNGLVCDAHQPGGPGSERFKRGYGLVGTHPALKNPEDDAKLAAALDDHTKRIEIAYQQQFHPLPEGLSEDALRTIHKELQKFDDGNPLPAKVRKLLEAILRQDETRRREVQKTRNG